MRSIGPTSLRALATLLGVVAFVGQITYLDSLSWHRLGLTPPMIGLQSGAFITLLTAHAVVSIAAAGLGIALVLHEGPRQAPARALGLSLAAWAYLLAYSGITLMLRPAAPGLSRTLFEGHFLVVELLGLIGLLRFTALFPRNLLATPIPRPAELAPALGPLHVASVWMLRPYAPWLVASLLAGALWLLTLLAGRPPGDAALHPLMDISRVAAASLAVLSLYRSWARADVEGSARLAWLLVALAALVGVLLLYIGANVLVGVTEWPEPGVAWRPILVDLGVLAFLTALALSVLYRGSRDTSLLARRILASCTVAALGFFLAAALEALFSGGVLAAFSLRTGVGTVIAVVVVVTAHRALIQSVDRLIRQIPIADVA